MPSGLHHPHPHPEANGSLPCGREFGSALEHALDLPLAALRATLESLSQRLPEESNDRRLLGSVLDEVDRVGRNVRYLLEYAAPRSPMPLRSSIAEIIAYARSGLTASVQSRVVIARENAEGTIVVDAPLLAKALRRLVENAVEAGSDQILIIVRRDEEKVSFRVVDGSPATFDGDWARSAFHSTKHNHLGLGLAITERDVELMDGHLDVERSPHGDTIVTVTVPTSALESGGLAA